MKLTYTISLVLFFIAGVSTTIIGQASIDFEYDHPVPYDNLSLEFIPTLDGHTSTIAKNVISRVSLDTTGTANILSNHLPSDKMMYRLALQEPGVGIGIQSGIEKNYIHIVMDNKTEIQIADCDPIINGLANCQVKGNPESIIIQKLYDEMLPAIYQDRYEAYSIKTETKEEFVKQKHIKVFKEFADTCQYLIPTIMSLHLFVEDDLQKAIKEDPAYFKKFIDKVQTLAPDHPYTAEIKDIITDLHPELKTQEKEGSNNLPLFGLIAACLLLLLHNLYLRRQLSKAKTLAQANTAVVDIQARLARLSPKEKEVFELMKSDLSNKEIASKLYVETTTVKSHISKIYQKLQISSRKEISQFADNQGRTT